MDTSYSYKECLQENSFSVSNKTVMEPTVSYLETLNHAESTPDALRVDSSHVLAIIKAESCRLDDLQSSAIMLERMKKVPNQSLVLNINQNKTNKTI